MQHLMTYYTEATPQEQHAFRIWIKSILHQGPVTVTFYKADGTERDMVCTLQEGIAIPHEKTTDRVKPVNDEVCPVWDIDKGAWRSFRYDSVIKINIDIGVEDVTREPVSGTN